MLSHIESLAISAGLMPAPLAVAPPVEAAEQEINRLTWLVLDGRASAADQARLAELVRGQHAARRRARS
ncbi:MAG TPA: hypothetical protein PKC18_07540 [Lacipirellulaceae bacterium]|nr:hypothetical protein [Lacipirellulaceae bacterium]